MPRQRPQDNNLAEPKHAPLVETENGSLTLPSVLRVSLEPTARRSSVQQPFEVAVRNRCLGIGFQRYKAFIDRVLCQQAPVVSTTDTPTPEERLVGKLEDLDLDRRITGVGAYNLLKTATEVFLLLKGGVVIGDPDLFSAVDESRRLGRDVDQATVETELNALLAPLASDIGELLGVSQLPYIRRILRNVFSDQAVIDSPFCEGVPLTGFQRETAPLFLELIWSYWMEEAGLVQGLNMIALRFQNRRAPDDSNPLAHLTLDPLRPLSNFIWGYIQDEFQRLTVVRRAYEYDHHYGLSLVGKAVPELRTADSRSKFLPAFHELLFRATVFFKDDDDTTRIADAFPTLRALREVHLLLAEGAHNQFGDLPWTARVEMLVQQWLLARPEMRDFLQSRPMVPYAEQWMPQMDTIKKLMDWTDISVTQFRDLAVFAEQLLLSIRYGDWIDINDPQVAANWARYWRPEIQSYIHAYHAITGVDLAALVTEVQRSGSRDVVPSVHLARQIEARKQNGRAQITAGKQTAISTRTEVKVNEGAR
jgi:hypothetical protein